MGLRRRLVDLRRRATLAATDKFFVSLSAAGRMHPLAAPERHNVELVRDVPYVPGGDAAHRLDVWRPRDASPDAPRPCIFYVHGGGFRILSKDTHWIMGLMFARAGYVVFNVNYRLAPAHPFPEGLRDVCDALRWVADHATEYGADPGELVFAGESAGANLVTALTLATCYARPEPWARAVFDRGVVPRVVLPACGLLQVTEPGRFARRWPHLATFAHDQIVVISEQYLSRAAELDPRTLDLADPLLVLERGDTPDRPLPPFFVSVGTRDPLLDDARRLTRALVTRGVDAELAVYAREPHAFHAVVLTKNARRCWRDTFRFLGDHLGAGPDAERMAGPVADV